MEPVPEPEIWVRVPQMYFVGQASYANNTMFFLFFWTKLFRSRRQKIDAWSWSRSRSLKFEYWLHSRGSSELAGSMAWSNLWADSSAVGLHCATITWFTSSYDSRRFAAYCCLLLLLEPRLPIWLFEARFWNSNFFWTPSAFLRNKKNQTKPGLFWSFFQL